MSATFQRNGQGPEPGDHRLPDPQTLRSLAEARVCQLLLGAQKDEDGYERQHRPSPRGQAGDDKEHGDNLSHPGRQSAVAVEYRICVASKARSTRPPSMGKAGIRLNSTSRTFTKSSLASRLPLAVSMRTNSCNGKHPADHEENGDGYDNIDGRSRDRDDQLLPGI